MLNPYENETEEQNNFWSDVYYYMKENKCDKETAIKSIEPLYKQYKGAIYMEYQVGDMVLVPRGQKTKYFEVKEITETKVIIEDGYVRVSKYFDEVILICRKEDRKDLN